MALVLTLRQGEGVYVANALFVMDEIVSEREFVLRRDKTGETFRITEGRSYPIMENVRVSIGARGQNFLARVVFEAPRSIGIVRADAAS